VHAYGFEHFLPAEGPPVLVTLHLPVSWYPPRALAPARPGVAFNCVSHAQKRLAPALGDAPLVPNGVAAHRFLCRRRKFPFALALGRICPEKGFHLAIAAATAARMPLVLAGRVFGYTSHEAYFRDHIAPTLGRACRFIGPAAFGRKRRLLAAARCLLVPSLVPETTCLVALEALASGTPVIAFRAGALAEIIESGHTGFLVDSVDEMAAAIAEAASLDPRSCRRRAEERFPLAVTVEKYLELYERLRDTEAAVS
jgi:glycosyltransferase involved in cell wall biosynthesis